MAERLRKALKALVVSTVNDPLCFTVRIGVASLVQADLPLEQIIKLRTIPCMRLIIRAGTESPQPS